MFKDFRQAYRTLRKHPGFSLTAIVSIALAIGANSAIFSLQDALLLRPLAVSNPSTLVAVKSRTPSGELAGFPYPDVVDLRERNRSFDGLVAYRLFGAGVATDEHAQPQFRAGLLVITFAAPGDGKSGPLVEQRQRCGEPGVGPVGVVCRHRRSAGAAAQAVEVGPQLRVGVVVAAPVGGAGARFDLAHAAHLGAQVHRL